MSRNYSATRFYVEFAQDSLDRNAVAFSGPEDSGKSGYMVRPPGHDGKWYPFPIDFKTQEEAVAVLNQWPQFMGQVLRRKTFSRVVATTDGDGGTWVESMADYRKGIHAEIARLAGMLQDLDIAEDGCGEISLEVSSSNP